MRRRELLILGSTAFTWPLVVRAQQKAMAVIGLLSPFTRPDTEVWHQGFQDGLRDLTYRSSCMLE